MKKTHKGISRAEILAAQSSAKEKRRILIMGVALVILLAGFYYSQFKANEFAHNDDLSKLSAPAEMVVHVQVPDIDAAAIDALVSDSSDEDRVLLEREAVDEVLPIARNLTPAHFAELKSQELDRTLVDELLANPSQARGKAFFARGWITSLRVRSPGGGRPKEVHGRLVLEDYSTVYFIVAEQNDSLAVSDFARVDGLFLKAFNDEDPEKPGEWVQGPLLIGPELQRSYKSLGKVTSLPIDTFIDVQDDSLEGGITGIPFLPHWTLMAFARDHDRSEIDWKNTPALESETVNAMLNDGKQWRGRAFHMTPLKVLAISERIPGENPARMEKITEGWLASFTWKGNAKVVYFTKPGEMGDIRPKDIITGSGFFLKNFAYELESGGMHMASMVVLDSLEKHVGAEDHSVGRIWFAMTIGTGVLIVTLVFLIMRDRKRAAALHKQLAERRRARRSFDQTSAVSSEPSA